MAMPTRVSSPRKARNTKAPGNGGSTEYRIAQPVALGDPVLDRIVGDPEVGGGQAEQCALSLGHSEQEPVDVSLDRAGPRREAHRQPELGIAVNLGRDRRAGEQGEENQESCQ